MSKLHKGRTEEKTTRPMTDDEKSPVLIAVDILTLMVLENLPNKSLDENRYLFNSMIATVRQYLQDELSYESKSFPTVMVEKE